MAEQKQVRFKLIYPKPEQIKQNDLSKFKSIEGEKWEIFLNDIKKNGIREPIVLNKSMEIIDGRNRLRAVDFLGWDSIPAFQVMDNLTPQEIQEWVDKSTFLRRHMEGTDTKEFLKEKYLPLIQKKNPRSVKKGQKTFYVAKYISQRTGLPLGTVDRLLADIRKELEVQRLKDREFRLPAQSEKDGIRLLIRMEREERDKAAVVKEFDDRILRIRKNIESLAPVAYFKSLRKKNQKAIKIDD